MFLSGKEKYQAWIIRFEAYARVKQFMVGLKANSDLPATEADGLALDRTSTDVNGIEQIKALDMNYLAVTQLTITMGTDALLNKVQLVCTTDWPGSKACDTMTELKREFKPVD